MRGVDLTWAGGEHTFLLGLDLLRALEVKCDAGPMHILQRLSSGQWYVDDIIETIRLGLEGGGLPKDAARNLVKRYIGHDEPLTSFVLLARTILMAALYGAEDDPPGESKAGENQSPTHSLAENGDGPAFTSGVE
ncbi:gene transfer agent family protein [Rhizobium sp. AB2/73]|uniref:gene transfer agent family protein n=1 Tax=Rhizobium sp. AB2/73 TaxID=2795216 RepID=UPI001C5D1DCC|nr:gene transfer agent family protein [Rhizobium sp. AB2/73]QYA12944.1 gene transfer agent family protein [Rhizobium sp. AB2/73]UEQ81123.1 gene transfer agent family protein [Rhizobium sp. AB2/73]